uniref:AMP-dependent synthetase/ligase domain-containing protein n=1 Tax=Amphimedon queenslandica TaxID=400682 RepID=A0A1X7T2N8_AMPQE
VNIDPNTGAPTDKLLDDVVKQFVGLGSSTTTVSQVLETKDSAVYSAIQSAIDKANESAISSAQKVQKFVILKNDLSIPGGELGPTLKLKRFYVMSKYSEVIDDMYSQ